jgi:hypothetical protein
LLDLPLQLAPQLPLLLALSEMEEVKAQEEQAVDHYATPPAAAHDQHPTSDSKDA